MKSFFESPRLPGQNLIASADEKCEVIGERFAGALSYGESVGDADDLPKMRERVALGAEARSGDARTGGGWEEPARLAGQAGRVRLRDDQDARSVRARDEPGADMLLVMAAASVEESAQAIGPRRFGFRACAQVDRWVNFPK